MQDTSLKILVVDDEPDLELLIRQRFRKKIQQKELEFVFAPNGVEALNVLEREPDVEILLTDINMPQMDGLTLLSRLREQVINPILKSIVVSAYGDMENIRTAMNRGAFDFITKPIDFNDLEITIEKTRTLLGMLKQAEVTREQLIAIRQELSVAQRIQQSILPHAFPTDGTEMRFDMYAHMEAAKQVGGDFYDFFFLDDQHLGVVIGDVSGKGVPAAIYMAMSRTLIRSTALGGVTVAECMAHVNDVLSSESDSGMFVTVFYGILDVRTGDFTYCNAGHNEPCVLQPSGKVEILKGANGLVLGVMSGMPYEQLTLRMQPGDSVYLYTDGVTEAMDATGGMYSDERLLENLALHTERAPADLVHRILDDVRGFTIGAAQSDDITSLALRYRGNGI
ncbi:MAG: SpoIIE family protein phosphatase [Ignavibacteriae bacterium]|nr:SpoIIE family protein phosphatase [Ignavibacteriota bacterium]